MKKLLITSILAALPVFSFAAETITSSDVDSSWEKGPKSSGKVVVMLHGDFAGSTVTIQASPDKSTEINTATTCTEACATVATVGTGWARAKITTVMGSPSIVVTVHPVGR